MPISSLFSQSVLSEDNSLLWRRMQKLHRIYENSGASADIIAYPQGLHQDAQGRHHHQGANAVATRGTDQDNRMGNQGSSNTSTRRNENQPTSSSSSSPSTTTTRQRLLLLSQPHHPYLDLLLQMSLSPSRYNSQNSRVYLLFPKWKMNGLMKELHSVMACYNNGVNASRQQNHQTTRGRHAHTRTTQSASISEALDRIKLVPIDQPNQLKRFLISLMENEELLPCGPPSSGNSSTARQEPQHLIIIDHLSSLNIPPPTAHSSAAVTSPPGGAGALNTSTSSSTMDHVEGRPDYIFLSLLEALPSTVNYAIMDLPEMDVAFYKRFFTGTVARTFPWKQRNEFILEVVRQGFNSDLWNAQILFEVGEGDSRIVVKAVDYRDADHSDEQT